MAYPIIYPTGTTIYDPEKCWKSKVRLSVYVGVAIEVLMDGREIGEFKQEGEKKIDMVLKVSEENISTPEKRFSPEGLQPQEGRRTLKPKTFEP